MLVHFPIALLSTGVLLRVVSLWTAKRPLFSFLLPAAWTILGLGVLAAWVTVIAGELARSIVEPTLDNIRVLDEHEIHAYRTAIGFTIALIGDWTKALFLTKSWWTQKGLGVVLWLLYLLSLTNLIITGSYGATLVYDEGAAVMRK